MSIDNDTFGQKTELDRLRMRAIMRAVHSRFYKRPMKPQWERVTLLSPSFDALANGETMIDYSTGAHWKARR